MWIQDRIESRPKYSSTPEEREDPGVPLPVLRRDPQHGPGTVGRSHVKPAQRDCQPAPGFRGRSGSRNPALYPEGAGKEREATQSGENKTGRKREGSRMLGEGRRAGSGGEEPMWQVACPNCQARAPAEQIKQRLEHARMTGFRRNCSRSCQILITKIQTNSIGVRKKGHAG